MEGKTTSQKEEARARNLLLQSLYLLQQFFFGDFFPTQSGHTHFMTEETYLSEDKNFNKIHPVDQLKALAHIFWGESVPSPHTILPLADTL